MIDGLKEAIRIIEKEIEYAKTINPQMTIGMYQVKQTIENRIKQQEIKNSY